jgi:CheY-like chemotaxis protein
MTTTAGHPSSLDGESPGIRILIVEDDEDLRALYSELLADMGRVETCPDAYQALARLEGERFDVIVLDLLLPGASGIELLDRLRAKEIDVPVVVVSGSGDGSELASQAHAAGAAVVMEKPFDRRMLSFNVAQAAARSPGRGH